MAEPFHVSVVIPAFNEAQRIAGSIAAIRAQTEPPLEIVVVDDGSTDGTASVAEALGARVLVRENGGIAAARNTGIRASEGTWLAFCDADDRWHPHYLAAVRAALEARPGVDFVFADHCAEVDGRVTLPSMFAASPEFLEAGGRPVSPGVVYFERGPLARALARRNFAAPSTIVVRREFVLARELYFDPALPSGPDVHVAEDIEWYLRVLAATDALAIDRVSLTYHRHAGSVSEHPGRVSYGVVKLGELVAAHPERYAPGVAAVYAAHRRHHVRTAATDDVRTFRFRSARLRLREAQAIRFEPADAALAVIAWLAELPGGRSVASAIRNAWRVVLKPVLRAAGRRAS